MRVFEVTPLAGVSPVDFGATRDTVRRALGAAFRPFRKSARAEHETDAFDTLGFHVYYRGVPPTVEFIELFHAEGSVFRYKGVDVFRTAAADLFRILADEAEWYNHVGSFVFPALQVAMYRSHPFDPDHDEFDRWESFAVACAAYYSQTVPKRAGRPMTPRPNPFAR